MLHLEKLQAEDFKMDEDLRRKLLSLTAPSYEDPSYLFAREFAHCNVLYLARDAEGEVICFFLVAWEVLEVPILGAIPALYLGLSAARQDAKNKGFARLLYHRCLNDAFEWEKEHNRKLILWGTTAISTAYLAAQMFLADTEPRIDGSYSPHCAELARVIFRKLSSQSDNDGHPFVLKNVAYCTRYSWQELEKIDRICRAKKFSLFHDLGVDETNGDRLLFIARTPEKLNFNFSTR